MTTQTISQKDAYVEKLEARLDQVKAQIAQLEARGREVEADAKVKIQRKVEDLRGRRESMVDTMNEIKQASGESWRALREGVEKALTSLTEGLSEAKERIEPALTSKS